MARRLRNLKIDEISLVDNPANPLAQIFLAKREPAKKGIPLDCPDCGTDLPTMYGASGSELPNFCPECGSPMSLSVAKADRADLADSDFAAVWTDGDGKKQRKLPIYDAAHIRNALARFDQTDMPANVKTKARAKLDAAAKKAGIGQEKTMKIDKSKLAPEVLAHIEKVEGDLAAAQKLLDEAGTPNPEPKEKDVLKGLAPEVRAIVEKATADAAKATKEAEDATREVAKILAERRTESFVKKAAALPFLPGSREELAEVMKSLDERAPEAFKKLEDMLVTWNSAIETGALFAERGQAGGGALSGSAQERLSKAAAAKIEKGEAKTYEEAAAIVFRETPGLYKEIRQSVSVQVGSKA